MFAHYLETNTIANVSYKAESSEMQQQAFNTIYIYTSV